MREPHVAQAVVILVERQAVKPERDAAAAAHHLGERRDARAQVPRFEPVLTEMVAPRSAISSSSSGRAQAQWASVRRGLNSPMRSR